MQNKNIDSIRIHINAKKAEIGAQLKAIRKSKGISMYSINKQYGLSRDRVIAIESGTSAYTIDSLILYSIAIGKEFVIDALITGLSINRGIDYRTID